ncbi:hypothetical protein LLT3_14510 [Lactococcus cremoris subsp. cremoris TIFN3]|uniref:Uncharacterized protein n=1 Tax=Lactococcus cremoris subsp. cremoris TIFN3 TaxID=1234873 RepID=T0VI66_LACLC|nr:hypothetical protein LLT3_14510 [Lactococcus cremoris subsp. cremoris TIFN3]
MKRNFKSGNGVCSALQKISALPSNVSDRKVVRK